MKLLLIFSSLILSAPAFSQSLSGTTWAFSGVGCRNGSLDADTHISKPPTSGDVTAGVIHFVDGSNINMTATLQGTETSHSGTYSVNDDEITVTGASGGGSMTIEIVEGRLIIVGSRTESVKECCNAKWAEGWRGYKEEVENWPGGTHPTGTWEEQKAKNGWDEAWLASNEEEFEALRDKCREEKPFVYVLGTVD